VGAVHQKQDVRILLRQVAFGKHLQSRVAFPGSRFMDLAACGGSSGFEWMSRR